MATKHTSVQATAKSAPATSTITIKNFTAKDQIDFWRNQADHWYEMYKIASESQRGEIKLLAEVAELQAELCEIKSAPVIRKCNSISLRKKSFQRQSEIKSHE